MPDFMYPHRDLEPNSCDVLTDEGVVTVRWGRGSTSGAVIGDAADRELFIVGSVLFESGSRELIYLPPWWGSVPEEDRAACIAGCRRSKV